MITEELCDKKTTLSKLAEPVFLYPQYTKNVRVNSKEKAIQSKTVQQAVKAVEEKIDGKGRVLVRKSGTEPVVRVMVECESEVQCVEFAQKIADVIVENN